MSMIHVSQAASQEIKRLQMKQSGIKPVLHLDLQQGSCADWIYSLTFIEQPNSEDVTLEVDALTLALPSRCLPLIKGLIIDYGEDLMGGGFRFTNPNATYTCGCGTAFSIAASTHSPTNQTPRDCLEQVPIDA